ncbi:GTP cyclohydrolase II [Streptomyces sp. NPDC001903]|uniref:GTP cyclohydrolase II n=1 Tax=Streptomyces sp. NPDC001903 TaxID=3364622 RepID=UPI0036743387
MTSELLQLHTPVSTELQTPFGGFTVSVPPGEPGLSDRTCVALHRGPLDQPGPLVRIHSACLFSETFSSMDCDCADQLRSSMELIAREGRGVIVYQYQEGRGQGLEAKIRGMAVMDRQNLTTAGAYASLGLAADVREYEAPLALLDVLGVHRSVRVMTRNPRKLAALARAGYEVREVVALDYPMTPRVRAYVASKQSELGHLPDQPRT